MQLSKNKTMAISIALLLSFSLSGSMILLPTVNAQTTSTVASYAYLVAAPNPVGQGQTAAVVMWIDTPLPGAAVSDNIRRHDYSLTITNPNGDVQTENWTVVQDSTSVQYWRFTPTIVGNYTLKFDYPAQNYTWSGQYFNTTFLAASKTITLTVQQEPIQMPIDSYPMPTEYWTRPIEGQNTYWYTIASNWLGQPYVQGAGAAYGIPGAYQPDGSAPDSAHIMWTKPIQYGGVVGGNDTAIPGEMYYGGLSYNTRFSNPIIMQGTLFYQEPYGNTGGGGSLFGGGGDYVAVDLRTGQELWRIDPSATGISLVPSFGYLYSYESPNQHGVLPNGVLIAPYTAGGIMTPYGPMGGFTCWAGYDPATGELTSMNITNIPSGVAVEGPSGEYLIYTLTNYGTAENPNWYLAQWNSSNVFGGNQGMMGAGNWYTGTANASLPSAYDWNVSIPTLSGTGWVVGKANLNIIPLVDVGNIALLIQGSFGGHPGDYGATMSSDPANITAVSLKPQSLGQVLWTKSYQQAPDNNTRFLTSWDPSNGVFIFTDKESMVHYGYSLSDGNLLWGPVAYTNDFTNDWNYLALGLENIAYGKLYVTGYSGILYCYDDTNGTLLWTYGNGGEGNTTLSGFTTPYGRYPTFISTIADGKIYLDTTEHSPNSPLYKGAELRCINATDGTEMWTIMDYGNQMYGGQSPIADGYLTTLNSYDAQIYCYGKGPSATTVQAPMISVTVGNQVVIQGSVMDTAAGTQQAEQAARFPNGVPAVSDTSQSAWMEYVYMQKPKPTNTTGVEVSIDAIDPNNNLVHLGTATSDPSGLYSLAWTTPDVPGKYTIIATFAGSESYYGSYAETAAIVAQAPEPTPQPTPTPAYMAETYFLPATIGMILAIVIATAVIVMMLRKRP
jgi:hypothetical protein